ncbi:MAG: exodeoxyribonuclease V subunit beta [Geobacteraceae bacterium GWC2_53_11]|nr:MAG: exodeoxyribonuclease V subunit beta [Geobacteraceae bacterium GWC2_53_11]
MKPLNLASIELSGLNLIEASAGTGKTWTIAALYILLLLEKELRPEQILVVTYTKAATAELRERIRRRIADTLDFYSGRRPATDDALEQLLQNVRVNDTDRARQLLTRALYSFDDAAIFTIHGFCQRALLENTFESGSLFGTDMISDQSTLVKQVCDDFWRSRILSQPDEIIESLTAGGYTPERLVKPLEGHLQNPDLIIIPQPVETPLAPLILEQNSLSATTGSLWTSDRPTILEQLEQARLSQQSYKPAQIEAAANALDSWAAERNATLPVKALEMFSTQKIISKMTKSSPFTPDHPFFSLCQQMVEVQNLREEAFLNTLIASRHELKQWLERELSKRKTELNQRSFDDLLLDLHAALEANTGAVLAEKLRQRYRAAMIDEFQDTDPLQWNIFQRIGAEREYPLFLIGDPKQAIYSFRGADVFAYLNAARKVPSEQTQTLTTNFRSDKFLITAVNTLFAAATDPFMSREIPFHTVQSGRQEDDLLLLDGIRDEAPFKLWVYPRNGEPKTVSRSAATRVIVQSVAAEAARLLEPGRTAVSASGRTRPLTPNDIAILVKSHKQADQVQEELLALGIPSVQLGSSTIFETPEALDLVRILRAVAEPHREALLREALLTESMGLSAGQVSQYVECSGEHPEWESWLIRFRNLHAAAETGGVVAVVSRLLGSCGVRERILSSNGGERCLTNILHCCEMLHQVEREEGKNLSGLITWLERKIGSPRKEDVALLRLETDENAVIISTIHASKGLQYPVVFVPFAWDASSATTGRTLFHNDQGNLVLDLAGEEANKKSAAAELRGEAARLLYVALTRAEFRCYAVWGAINGAADSPLCHLLQSGSSADDGKQFSALGDQEALDAIRTLSRNGHSGISAELMPVDTPATQFHPDVFTNTACAFRTLSHPPRDDWRIASFSGMTAGAGHTFEPHDHDSLLLETPPGSSGQPSDGLTIFDFPRGAKAGTCLHELFELLDFSRLDSDSVSSAAQTALAGNGFPEKWLPAVQSMVTDVTAAGIIPGEPDFNLHQLHKGDWQTEMEFYLPVSQLAPATLQALFEGVLDKEMFRDYHELLGRLSFRQSRGMLQGFIDLVFSYGGRFYILDWKSNHLGMKPADYAQEAMHESMCRSAYILQYHLYTLALDRLLKLRLPGYRYETHFGGAIYVYLRGISGEAPMNGIYFDRPLPGFIRRAEELLLD